MVAYTGIQGQNILITDTDPANPTQGQIWYNTTSNLLKGRGVSTTGSWATASTMNTARGSLAPQSVGTATSTLAAGGSGYVATVETYNGTTWSPATSLNDARMTISGVGAGVPAAIVFAGYDPPGSSATEAFNGSTWTSLNTLANALTARGGVGQVSTAALALGGYRSSGPTPTREQNVVESWNGTSWSSNPIMNTTREGCTGMGTQTSAIGAGGYFYPGGGFFTATESWNGSAWTTVNSLNTAGAGRGGAGVQTLGLVYGGEAPSYLSATELWNGTSWTSNPTGLATARRGPGSTQSGSQTSALAFGGSTPTSSTGATEVWTGPGTATTRTLTTS
jgi:hypothetical protein